MDGIELIFGLLLFGYFSLLFVKLSNVLTVGKLYKEFVSWMVFIIGLFVYGLLFNIVMVGYSYYYFVVLFRFASFSLVLFIIFHFIELFWFLSGSRSVSSDGRGRGRGFR